MTPVTLAPLCVKTTSDAPKSLPLVHHLPSIDAGAVFARRFVVAGVAGLIVFAGGVREVLLELVLDLVPPVVVLPPAG